MHGCSKRLILLLLFIVLDGATSCGSITVSATNSQSQREGLYQLQTSGNSSSCSGLPVWKSQLTDSWLYYSADDGAWYIGDVSCGDTTAGYGIHFLAIELNFNRAMQCSAKCGIEIACRLSVCNVQDHTGWKSWKLIARTISPTPSLCVAQRPSTYSQGNMGKFG